ncbi:MAG: acyl-CoA dehydrogenase [Rhodospirillaceae bacterium]|jgi:acyl-CoA dehydrogenase|nr:acyl-CoA dehydrogenase [Rhodospirillaceae bacterium]MBT4485995.1 acyl-CoA dehydrogenase [Rhodospirillaceae bacterium]MBT5896008.1 acyl-CoA dehydrogenase [Rhodospirillaceae bacterium]MBT7756909.1 acyl-CoA dehydrogenase [Rhodospirillaceae bacterium]
MQNPFENEERRAYRDTVRRFLEAEVKPHTDDWDEAGEIPWEMHEKIGALGIFGFGIEEQYGGLGFDDCFMRAAGAEEFGRAAAGSAFAAVGGRSISIAPIQLFASEEWKQKILPEVVSGRMGSSLAITEPSGGSDVANLKTNAKRDGNHFVLNGSKTFITGGMKSDYFVVGARTSDNGLKGISLFLVPADTPGFSRTAIERKMGWWASDTATLYFDDCRVPAENMLGEEGRGFMAIMNNFNMERLGMTAQVLGMSKHCLDESVAWAQERQTFGQPLIKHQVIRHKIADMSAKIDALEAYVNQICWQANEGEMPVAEIAKSKFLGTKTLEFCASEAMQILGGAGYLRGNSVERTYREVKVMAIGGGSEEIMRDLAVREMGL